MMLQAGQRS